jgi:hypothetical protein
MNHKPRLYEYENWDVYAPECCCCGSLWKFSPNPELIEPDDQMNFWEPACDCYEMSGHSFDCSVWGIDSSDNGSTV